VIQENSVEAAIAKEGAAEFSDMGTFRLSPNFSSPEFLAEFLQASGLTCCGESGQISGEQARAPDQPRTCQTHSSPH